METQTTTYNIEHSYQLLVVSYWLFLCASVSLWLIRSLFWSY